jgi:hypothetical protein
MTTAYIPFFFERRGLIVTSHTRKKSDLVPIRFLFPLQRKKILKGSSFKAKETTREERKGKRTIGYRRMTSKDQPDFSSPCLGHCGTLHVSGVFTL